VVGHNIEELVAPRNRSASTDVVMARRSRKCPNGLGRLS
jgi:hypothetical protein